MSDEFFVGYLPVKPHLRRFVLVATAAALLLVIGLGIVVAAAQRDPGRGSWKLDQVADHDGLLLARPAPLLRVRDADGRARTVLLIAEGKHGTTDVVARFDGHLVRARGTLIERDGVAMLELVSDGIRDFAEILIDRASLELPAASDPKTAPMPISLRGEVIDPKCFLGAMKPGEGKTHKACAALCLRGGVPPMFATLGPDGRVAARLIDSPDVEQLVAFVGDLVDIVADEWRCDDLRMIRIREIRRVGS
ncbi:MAG: hypothetical protein QM770_04945 [Tepidisphaeraceae bacterium]